MSVSSEIERIQNGVSEQTELISQIQSTLSSKTSLPTELPNPYPLIFTGAVTENYDGSKTVTVDIPVCDISDSTITDINGILKGNGSNVAVAVAGTDYVAPANLSTKVNRTTAVNEADTNYTTLMARGEKLMAKADFDAVTDWSTELVNGAIAWGYE